MPTTRAAPRLASSTERNPLPATEIENRFAADIADGVQHGVNQLGDTEERQPGHAAVEPRIPR